MFIRASHPQTIAHSSSSAFAIMIRSSHGVRVIELGSRMLTLMWLLIGVLLAWYLFATLYLVMRDDLVVSMLSSQRRAQYAYEDRIVDLRTKIEQMSAKQVVNQDSIEDRVSHIIARQAELEARQVMVSELGTRAVAQSSVMAQQQYPGIPISSIPNAPPVMPSFMDKNTKGTLSFAPNQQPLPAKPTPLDQAPVAEPVKTGKTLPPITMRGSIPATVKEIEKRASLVEKSQFQALEMFESSALSRIDLGRKTIVSLGLDMARFGKLSNDFNSLKPIRMIESLDAMVLRDVSQSATTSAMGGPLLPPRPVQDSERFEHYFGRSENALNAAQTAQKILRSLPIGRPLDSNYDITSSFGTRVDPFTRGYALHAGIDFRAPTGTPIQSISTGTVIHAGPSGGYGKLVEIDHGYGLTTRYAHLSAVRVEEGQQIEKGDVIGLVGSTGRSTGPHLHYEVRIDDDATDPMRYIRAAKIMGVLAE